MTIMSATIRLTRVGSNPGPGSLRPLQVLVDGKKVDQIKLGETKTLTVPAGNHRVQVKQDFSASDPITLKLEEGATQALECGSLVEGVMFFLFIVWAWRVFVPGKLFYLKRKSGR
jgi:hypothetical protein